METLIISADQIEKASQILKNGGLLAFPTDTVFGVGAVATNKEAVQRIFTVKKRPLEKPLIILCSDIEMVMEYADLSDPVAEKLAKTYWPGPMTLVLPKKPGILPTEVTAGKETIAVRIPAQSETRKLVEAVGEAIVAPSANLAGEKVAESTEEILEIFSGKIDGVLELDADAKQFGQPSTIVEVVAGEIVIHRQGALAVK